ncbi:MAG: WD40 repeat domain-containing protein, partial [Nostoc sp.]
WCVACSTDGQTLASGSADTTIRLWDIHTGECLKTLSGHTHTVRSLTFTPDGKTLIASDDNQTVKFWNIHRCNHQNLGFQDLPMSKNLGRTY